MAGKDDLDLDSTLDFANLRDLLYREFLLGGGCLDTEAGLSQMESWVLAKLSSSSSQDSTAACGPHLNLTSFRKQSLALEERLYLLECSSRKLTPISSKLARHVVQTSVSFKRGMAVGRTKQQYVYSTPFSVLLQLWDSVPVKNER